jgi:hypothetical protein
MPSTAIAWLRAHWLVERRRSDFPVAGVLDAAQLLSLLAADDSELSFEC